MDNNILYAILSVYPILYINVKGLFIIDIFSVKVHELKKVAFIIFS